MTKNCNGFSEIFVENHKTNILKLWNSSKQKEKAQRRLSQCAFEFLISTDNSPENAEIKISVIENICNDIISLLKLNSITKATCNDLEKHAYSVNDFIENPSLRNASIFAGV